LKIFHFRSFVAADVDFDGKVSVDEFDSMIEAAAALPRSVDEFDSMIEAAAALPRSVYEFDSMIEAAAALPRSVERNMFDSNSTLYLLL